jgi:type IV pilus assembly protein PilO
LKLTRHQIETIILVVIVVVGGGWAYWRYLYGPVAKELKECRADFERKKMEVEKLKVIPMVLERETRELQVKRLELDRVKEKLPKEKEVPTLLENITLTAQSSDIDLLTFTPGRIVEGEVYDEFPIRIEIKGNYHDIGSFLSGIGNLERVIVPSNLQLTALKPTPEEPYTVSTSLKLSTYVYKER